MIRWLIDEDVPEPEDFNQTVASDIAAEEKHNSDAYTSLLLNVTLIGCLLLAYYVKVNRIYSLPERCVVIILSFESSRQEDTATRLTGLWIITQCWSHDGGNRHRRHRSTFDQQSKALWVCKYSWIRATVRQFVSRARTHTLPSPAIVARSIFLCTAAANHFR